MVKTKFYLILWASFGFPKISIWKRIKSKESFENLPFIKKVHKKFQILIKYLETFQKNINVYPPEYSKA